MQLDFVTVDVFTSKPYEGNPLAIIRIPEGFNISQEQKQRIAREFNLSESTFLHERNGSEQDGIWTVDIFMTDRELPFAGHPTVGTACYVLSRVARERHIEQGTLEASFKLKAGPVQLLYDVVRKTAKAAIPHDVHIHSKRWDRGEILKVQPGLAQAYSEGRFLRMSDDFAIVSIVKGMTFVLIELESLDALESVTLAGKTLTIDGLDQAWDDTFVGSYFFVRIGRGDSELESIRTRMIEGPLEDPATGSAASDLAAYLTLQDGIPGQTSKYKIIQGVEMGRRSEILVDVQLGDDGSVAKVYLSGGAVAVMEGRVTV